LQSLAGFALWYVCQIIITFFGADIFENKNEICAEPHRIYAYRELAHGFVCLSDSQIPGRDFILRIEDTDTSARLKGLSSYLQNSEGDRPAVGRRADIGGAYGPYIQSERRIFI
jgi:hypothetical protein